MVSNQERPSLYGMALEALRQARAMHRALMETRIEGRPLSTFLWGAGVPLSRMTTTGAMTGPPES